MLRSSYHFLRSISVSARSMFNSPKKRAFSSSRVSNTSPKKKKKYDHLFVPPKDWKETYELIKFMRSQRNAPVDAMGAECLAQSKYGKDIFNFQVIISLLLSSHTRDQKVHEALRALQAGVKPRFDAASVLKTPKEQITEHIRPVGFYNTKTKNLIRIASVVVEKFNGQIPTDVETMIKEFPGIGPKMAFISANIINNKPVGIGVDV